VPSIKYATFFRRTTILAAIFIAGGALTALVDQATWEKAAATLVATVIAIALMPRLWLRFGAFIVFWAFRIMVGLGLLMAGLGLWGVVLWLRRRIDSSPIFLRACVAMGPAGFVAVVAGWIVAEVGRQPYVVYGQLRTADGVSPVPTGHVAFSLVVFMAVYAVIFTAGVLYMLRLIAEGPGAAEPAPEAPRPPGTALGAAPGQPKPEPSHDA